MSAARTGFTGRLSAAWTALVAGGVVQDPAPMRKGSPEEPTAQPPANMFSRAYDGFAVGATWLQQLAVNDDSILKREGIQDLKLFDALLDDDVAFATFMQRVLALVSRPWVVEPGNPDDPRSVQAADDLRKMLDSLGWDRVVGLMMFARWYGFGIAEGIFSIKVVDGRSLVWLDDIVVPDRKWFAFTNAGELRMRTPQDQNGLAVPPNKFWAYRTGATHDFAHYGTGLAHWCYWPIWFKRNVLQFWALYLEKYGQPTAVGYFQPGASDDTIAALVSALQAIGSDSAVALPAPPQTATGGAGQDLKPHLIEAQRSGGADSYRDFVEGMNNALRGTILGQPGTSSGVSGALGSDQAEVHKDVRDEVVKADSDGLHESFNRTFPRWLTEWNYGPDVAPPTVYRNLDDGEDLNTTAERDSSLDGLGWQRTEDSFRETYGEGYERKPEPVVPAALAPGIGHNGAPAAANDNIDPADQREAVFAAGDPRPLYISRKLDAVSARALLAWADKAGFTNLEPAADLHVTQCYSRTPVDWFDMPTDNWGNDGEGNLRVRPGGPRAVEVFGGDAVVLMISSESLSWRASDLKGAGASYDHDPYRPHVTFAKGAQTVDLATVDPFTGNLQFGPEIWEALDTDPVGPPLTPEFSADQLDAIDAMTAAMMGESDPIFQAMADGLKDRIAEFTAGGRALTPEAFRVAALQAWERFPVGDLARVMALPFAAERAAAAAGVEDQVEP